MHMGSGAYDITGRRLAPENIDSLYPRVHGNYYASQQDMEIRPFMHSLSSIYGSFWPYLPLSGSSFLPPDNNSAYPSLASDNNDHLMDGRRRRRKRKRFGISEGYARGSTNRIVDAGSSSNYSGYGRGSNRNNNVGSSSDSLFYGRGSTNRYSNDGSSYNSEIRQDWLGFGSQNYASSSASLPQYSGLDLAIDNEDPHRNVRRRSGLDGEVNPSTYVRSWEVSPRRTNSTSYLSTYHDSIAQNFSRPVESTWLDGGRRETLVNSVTSASAMHGRFRIPRSSASRTRINDYSSGDYSDRIYDSVLNRNSFLPQSHEYGHPVMAGLLEGCVRDPQREIPSYWTNVGTADSEQVAPSGSSLQIHSESYTSGSSRSVGRWHSAPQEQRTNTSTDRIDSQLNSRNGHDETYEAMANRVLIFISTNILNEYRNMGLDTNNMNYEELVSLGERIGNVRTGLSNNVIPKCLVKTTYSWVDDSKEGLCVICQEDYSDMDEVAKIENCGHSYHSGCITKWLLIKNACPICQGPAFTNSRED